MTGGRGGKAPAKHPHDMTANGPLAFVAGLADSHYPRQAGLMVLANGRLVESIRSRASRREGVVDGDLPLPQEGETRQGKTRQRQLDKARVGASHVILGGRGKERKGATICSTSDSLASFAPSSHPERVDHFISTTCRV